MCSGETKLHKKLVNSLIELLSCLVSGNNQTMLSEALCLVHVCRGYQAFKRKTINTRAIRVYLNILDKSMLQLVMPGI